MNEKTKKLVVSSEALSILVKRLNELENLSSSMRKGGYLGKSANIQHLHDENSYISAEIDKSLAIKVVDEQILKIKDRIITVTQELEQVAKS